MNRKQTGPIPEAIAQLQRQFDQFRSTQPRRTKLPEPLWQAAVDLAREHGIYPVAHPLRLDYVGLKKRLSGVSHSRARAPKPKFVELTAPQTIPQHECAIDLECPSGHRMHIQWKAAAPIPSTISPELQRHAEELKRQPSEWMPWNYRDTLARLATPAAA